MQCEDIESLLYAHVMGEATDIETFRIKSHVSECRSCREAGKQLGLVVDSLKAEAAPAPVSPRFRTRIQDAVIREMALLRRRRFLLAALWSGAALAACLCIAIFRTATGHSGEIAEARVQPVYGKEQVWKIENVAAFPSSSAQTPVSSNGRVFAIEKSGNGGAGIVVAIEVSTGKVVWHSRNESYGFLSVDSGRLYGVVPAANGGMELAAFDAAHGNLLWRHAMDAYAGRQGTSAAVAAGDGVCWTQGNAVECLAKTGGRLLWRRRFVERSVASNPVVAPGRIVVASGGDVFCLTYDNTVVWKRSFARPMSSLTQPQVECGDGLVFIAHREISGSPTLLCLEQSDGRVVWRKDNEEYGRLLAAGGRLYVRSNTVKALEGRSGKTVWSVHADGCSPLVLSGATLYLSESAEKGALLALDAQDGTVVRREASLGSCTGVIITQGLELVNSVRGGLYAIRQDRPRHEKSDI